jgi:hypothetical protein
MKRLFSALLAILLSLSLSMTVEASTGSGGSKSGGSTIALAQQPKPSIFIGPQMRDGFLDVDSGVRDSIRDIQQ